MAVTIFKTSSTVVYLDFHSTKQALLLVDSWSRAPDQIQMYPDRDTIDPYHSMSKQKILPVEPLIQCEAGRAKTMQRQSLYSPRTPKWPPSDKGEFHIFIVAHPKCFAAIVEGKV